MLIYNGREFPSKHMYADEVVIDLNGTVPLEVLLQKLRSGEDVSTLIHVNGAFETGEGRFITDADPVSGATTMPPRERVSAHRNLDGDDLEDYEDYYNARDKRSKIFKDYEAYKFGVNQDAFRARELKEGELAEHLYACLGIMPTLTNWNEKSVRELQAISENAEKLYWDFAVPEDENAIPSREDMEFFDTLNAQEKRIITNWIDCGIHPKLILMFAKKTKELQPGRALCVDDIAIIQQSHRNLEGAAQVATSCTFAPDSREVEIATGLFRTIPEVFAKYRGRAPRILNEYIEAQAAKREGNYLPSPRQSEQALEEVVKSFNLTSVQPVARRHSLPLLAFSDEINFAETKAELIDVLATYCPHSLVTSDSRLGFAKWLNAHKSDITAAQLTSLLTEYAEDLLKMRTKLNENETPGALIARLANAIGYSESKNFENDPEYQALGYKFENNELAIKGRHLKVALGGREMEMLQADDYRHFTVGEATHCCQRYNNAGESCVWLATSDPFASTVVITQAGRVVAQAFVWTDEAKSTFVFDNMEFANDGEIASFEPIIAEYVARLPYENVHMGTGYNQGMAGYGALITEKEFAQIPSTIKKRSGGVYSDYHSGGHAPARVFKKNGELLLHRSNGQPKVSNAPDEPTRWDRLATPLFAATLNECELSVEERIALAERLASNPSLEEQMSAVRRNPAFIAAIENPEEEVQLWIARNHEEFITSISNPCEAVQEIVVANNPERIREIPNPSERMRIAAVQANGMLLGAIAEALRTPAVCRVAIEQNAYALPFVPESSLTPEVEVAAIHSDPRIITTFKHPSDPAIVEAISLDPEVAPLIQVPISERAQIEAISRSVALINAFPNASAAVVEEAVRRDGRQIRNFQFKYPHLREVAIAQTPFAITALRNPTQEEVTLAFQVAKDMGLRRFAPMGLDPEMVQAAKQTVSEREEPCTQEIDLAE